MKAVILLPRIHRRLAVMNDTGDQSGVGQGSSRPPVGLPGPGNAIIVLSGKVAGQRDGVTAKLRILQVVALSGKSSRINTNHDIRRRAFFILEFQFT